MTIQAIRNILRNAFGARQYRITKDGEIHVHGVMPNTNIPGWYLYGHVGDSAFYALLEEMKLQPSPTLGRYTLEDRS